jgi:hypothetical protein
MALLPENGQAHPFLHRFGVYDAGETEKFPFRQKNMKKFISMYEQKEEILKI